MIRKQSTNPVNPGNPVQKPSASQLRRTLTDDEERAKEGRIGKLG